MRRDALARLLAAVVAIAARGERSRTDRALEVLRILSSEQRSRHGSESEDVPLRAFSEPSSAP
jgi:hypothetical protein